MEAGASPLPAPLSLLGAPAIVGGRALLGSEKLSPFSAGLGESCREPDWQAKPPTTITNEPAKDGDMHHFI
jgi:hypothetical protein